MSSWDDPSDGIPGDAPDPIRSIELGIEGVDDARPLNSGGNAIVYLARQPAMDRDVVVKILRAANDPAVKRRFDREQKAMGRLSQNPGIVPVYQSGLTATNDPYLVMPFYERGSLQDELDRGGRFDPERARLDLIVICDALQAAHDKGVLHRDLKPGNILRSNDGRPVLADFGIARIMDSQSSVSTALTLTPLYSPPEVFEGAAAAVSQDVYGLGAVLFALLNGRAAYDRGDAETSVLALMRRVTEHPLPALPADVPMGVVAAVRKAMAKKTTDRFGSVAEFGAALRAAHDYVAPAQLPRHQITSRPGASGTGVQGTSGPGARGGSNASTLAPGGYSDVIRPLHEETSKRSWAPLIGVALLIAAVAGAVGLALTRGSGTDSTEPPQQAISEIAEVPPDVETTTAVASLDAVAAQESPDLLTIAAALEAASVNVEGAACANGFNSHGVHLGDGRVMVPARYANIAWIADVHGGDVPVVSDVEAVLVWPEVGILWLASGAADSSGAARVPAQPITVASAGYVAIPDSDAPRSLVLTGVDQLTGMATVDADLTEVGRDLMVGAPVVDANAVPIGMVTDMAAPDQLAIAFDPAAVVRDVVVAGAPPEYDCPAVGGDVFPPGTDDQVVSGRVRSLLLAQRLANAFAAGDWPKARALEPAKAAYSDDRFVDGWGRIDATTMFPLRVVVRSDGVWDWRIGLVAHETHGGERVTTAFCVTWSVDLGAETIEQTNEDTQVLASAETPDPGWIKPLSYVETFAAQDC